MATNVTVLGASGSTVTIPFTSAANAAAAQTALNKISLLVQSTALQQYNYVGPGTVPAPLLFGGVVISGNDTVATGPLPQQEYSVVNIADNAVPVTIAGPSGPVATSLPGTTVIGAFNQMTVASGMSGIMFLNVSSDAAIFLGGGNNFIYQRDDNAKANINVDAGSTYVEATQGAATINAFSGAGMLVKDGGSGTAVINALAGSTSFLLDGSGGGSAPITVNGTTGSSMLVAETDGAAAFINPGAGNITVFGYSGTATANDGSGGGADAGGTATLFGGSAVLGNATVTAPAFTGAATVYGGTGYFAGGTGGPNLMHTSTLTGSTTLVGGHDGDTLYNHAAGNHLIAGAGSETLFGVQDSAVGGGSYFQITGGNATVFGDAAGGNHFFLGSGLGLITDYTGFSHGASDIYSIGQGGGTTLINDFVSGFDTFSLSNSQGAPTVSSLHFYANGDASNPFSSGTTGTGTEVVLSDSTKLFFYDANVKSTDFT